MKQTKASMQAAWLTLGLLFFLAVATPVQAALLVPTNSPDWRLFKGLTEASSPTNAWRGSNFNDAAFVSAPGPFWYGDVRPGGTQLTDMQTGYSCFFLRHPFFVSNVGDISSLQLRFYIDDGYVIWINGVEVMRYGVTDPLTIMTLAANQAVDPAVFEDATLPTPVSNYLVSGTNFICVQVFNTTLGSSDIGFDVQMLSVAPDVTPPVVAGQTPAPGTIGGLSQLVVNFSEAVSGVDAADLLINGTPATGVSGGGANYTFTFPQPPLGAVSITWALNHNIVDFGVPPNAFDRDAAGNSWSYTLVDNTAPFITSYLPATNTLVLALTHIEVLFNEAVTGVEAGDLLINNVPATGLIFGGPGQYQFTFPQPATGVVTVVWAPGHGIQDLAAVPNDFAGGAWTYVLNPNGAFMDVRINEFMADNQNGIRDENGSHEDWIELYNASSTVVNLAGWSLTDDAGNLGKWHFPAGAVMPANSYLLVWASAKDRTNNIAAYHTNFKLNKGGSFLALVLPDGTNVNSSFAPAYVAQRTDVSYGRDRLDPSILGFYNTPTPRAANSVGGPSGFASDVSYSLSSRTFVTPFSLTLSSPSTNAVIRYVLVTTAAQATAGITNVPTTNSPIYTSAIPISATTVVRARAFEPGLFPSTPMSESYIQIDTAVRDFSSDIPVVVVHMLGNGSIPVTTTTASGILMAFDNDSRRSSVTNAPQTASRMGIHARGSSTLGNAKTNMRIETWDEFNQDAKHPLLGNPEDSDWVLYGINGFDPGLMHNAIYQWLGRQLGVFNMRTRFVEVFNKLNTGPVTTNDYFGLYLLLETPKVGKDRVNIAKIQNQDTNAPAITGGYIMKIDRVDNERSFNPPQIGSIRTTPSGIAFTDPAYLNNEADPRRLLQINYAQNYILNFITNLDSASYTNPVTGYAQYINPDQWVNHLLANIIPFNVDGYRLSGFIYKDRNGRLEQGPMWDCDRCMGTGGTTTPQGDNRAFSPRFWRLPATSIGTDNGTDFFGLSTVGVSWFSRLFSDPDFWQKWIDRYQAVRTNEYSTNAVFAALDGWHAEIKEAQVREQARWGPVNFTWPRSGVQTVNGYTFDFGPADNAGRGRFSNEVAFQKQWFADRFDFFDTNFLRMPTLSHGTTLFTNGATVTAIPAAKAGSILLYTLDGTDPRLPGGAVAPGIRTNAGPLSLTISNNVRIFARSYNVNHSNVLNAGSSLFGNPLINSFWSGPVAATYYTAVPSLRITEIMYHPENPPAGNTNDPDNFEYIEVKNTGGTALNVQHFTLGGGIQFEFPSLVLAPGQSCVVVKDLAAFQSRYGTNDPNILIAGVYAGNLANNGDHLVLKGGVQEPILDFNFGDGWYPLADGVGFSIVIVDENAPLNTWSNKASWRLSSGEFGSPGVVDPAPPVLPVVYVNEALTHTTFPQLDTIELFNPGTNAVDISGWYLSDSVNTPKKFQIPGGTIIPAGGFVLFDETAFNTGPTAFSLNSSGDDAWVFSGTNGLLTGYAHGFNFAAAENGRTFGRYVNSQGNEDFVAQSVNTLGATNALPLVGPVVFSEIMYHPPELLSGTNLVDNDLDEFVELFNITTNTVLLYDPLYATNTWHLSKAVNFDFPTNVSLAPTSFVVVVNFNPVTNVAQLAAFRTKFGVSPSIPVFGPYEGHLDNSGANLHLNRPDRPDAFGIAPRILVDRVEYKDSGSWPETADGLGASLQRLVPGDYGNDPTNWAGARPAPGAGYIGGTPPVVTQQPANATVFVAGSGAMSTLYLTGTTNFTAAVSGSGLAYQWRFNGTVIPGATSFTLTLTNIQYSQAGNYSFLAFNGAGSAASSNATLTVLTPVTFNLQPTNQNVLPGTNVTLVAAATPSFGPIRYQWRFEGTNLPNATNASYSFTGANLASHHGNFSVAASDAASTVLSANAFIYVLVKPFIVTHITGQTVLQGGTAIYSVVATGAPPLWYRWIRGGTGIQTSMVPILILTNVQASGTIRCVVTNTASPAGIFSPASGTVPLTFLADFDHDGIADLWEAAYFGAASTNDASNALLDPDGDGMNNRDEYLAGTNPTNALSVLKVVLTSTNANVLQFLAQSNITYSVQRRTNFSMGLWLNLTNITGQTGVRTIIVDTALGPPASERYYRVVTPLVP